MEMTGAIVSMHEVKMPDGAIVFEGVMKVTCTPSNNLEISQMRKMEETDELTFGGIDMFAESEEKGIHITEEN